MNDNLKKLRLTYGLTQSQIAYKIGTCERHYRRIEKENLDPRTSISLAIAKVLNSTVEELFSNDK